MIRTKHAVVGVIGILVLLAVVVFFAIRAEQRPSQFSVENTPLHTVDVETAYSAVVAGVAEAVRAGDAREALVLKAATITPSDESVEELPPQTPAVTPAPPVTDDSAPATPSVLHTATTSSQTISSSTPE